MSKLFSRKVQFFARAIILPRTRTMVAAYSTGINIQAQPQIAIKTAVNGAAQRADFKLRNERPTHPPRVRLGEDHRDSRDLITQSPD